MPMRVPWADIWGTAQHFADSARADQFEAGLPLVDFDATGGEAKVIGFGAMADASVFALDSDGAVLAANRIGTVRVAVPCGAGPFVGLLLGARNDAPLTVGLLDVATLSVIETRTFPNRRSTG